VLDLVVATCRRTFDFCIRRRLALTACGTLSDEAHSRRPTLAGVTGGLVFRVGARLQPVVTRVDSKEGGACANGGSGGAGVTGVVPAISPGWTCVW
jgi:hypothetical protein